ncbi:S8 family serine peptidase [Motilibacter deserti]|uniref:S8 family serine peptidase n=1 Tax=Motilibacter deserti TaxID=2714956 RepID=A0ABX0GR97_9ACTN|nr:S8 family serine peptidase [Motilibacter deserti]NHC12384.1 S8 family serine peptidase [Motilibacter deserti]
MPKPAALTALLVVTACAGAVAAPAHAASSPRVSEGQAQPRAGDPRAGADAPAELVAGEVLVRFRQPARSQAHGARQSAVAEVGRAVQSLDAIVPGLERVALEPGLSVAEAVAELEARSDVAYAEPNYAVHAAAIPNDSRLPEMWGLHNTGQDVRGVAGRPDADIDAPEAWNVTTGSAAVTVAVLDSGVAGGHPDLAPNMWVNTGEVAGNGVDDDGNGFVDDRRGWDFVGDDNDTSDEQGHGTHVAATIGARGGNDAPGAGTTDVVGVAWDVRLLPVRVLDAAGEGSYADLIAGIDYARRNGAHIGNLSLGARYYSQALRDAMAAASGVTWVVAAGNDGSDLEWAEHYPCDFDIANLVCVAATDSDDELARFSNYGRRSVDVAAPGVDILSASSRTTVFSDDFETPIEGRWATGGTPDTWGRTTSVPVWDATGTWLTDSPSGRYPDGSDNWARTPAMSLRGLHSCVVQLRGVFDIESWFDFLRLEAATDAAGPWTEVTTFTGYWPVPNEVLEVRLPTSFDGADQAFLRFRLNPDDQYDGDGAYLDDVTVSCAGRTGADSYAYLSGTSMATPHVSGVAALIKARNPHISTAALRTKLLSSVDRKPSLTGRVATGGRINAARAVS